MQNNGARLLNVLVFRVLGAFPPKSCHTTTRLLCPPLCVARLLQGQGYMQLMFLAPPVSGFEETCLQPCMLHICVV